MECDELYIPYFLIALPRLLHIMRYTVSYALSVARSFFWSHPPNTKHTTVISLSVHLIWVDY